MVSLKVAGARGFKMALLAVLLLAAPLSAQEGLVLLDGFTADWAAVEALAGDPAGDGAPGGADFDSLWAVNQHGWLLLRFRTGGEFILQEDNDLRLLLDTDLDAGTGLPSSGIGADLVWRFGDKSGTYFPPGGGPVTVGHFDLRLVTAPTVSGGEFEVALRRDAHPTGQAELLGGPGVRIALEEVRTGGDRFPDSGGVQFTFSPDPGPPIDTLSLDRLDSAHVRLVTWNVLYDGIASRPEPFRRVLQAIQPDIIALQEVWSTEPAAVRGMLDAWLPLPGPLGWNAVKVNGDLIVASRWPITASWPIPEARASAHLIEAPGTGPVLVIDAHYPCCGNNEGRQWEIDATMAWLRDAMQPGGVVTLEENTPVIITGDMNLVGWRQQVETLQTGQIVNTDFFGTGAPPDWDGSELADLVSRQSALMMSYTWRGDASVFSPGRLDYILYTDSRLS
ncbi:MAG TPA: endonuclease/exonuclease/phosphatase family protein, partial [Bacteroidetes bacterium]|nr:endonuclease/exonuclease/phosphatase family protein [Bacteroidota bacterium]